jgi:hypothetical protein
LLFTAAVSIVCLRPFHPGISKGELVRGAAPWLALMRDQFRDRLRKYPALPSAEGFPTLNRRVTLMTLQRQIDHVAEGATAVHTAYRKEVEAVALSHILKK